MRGFVAPTDLGWLSFLSARPELREVNFWRRSQARFGAIKPGELFFFKLKHPHNAIAGFGLFTRHAVMPLWEAWDVFGAANGAAQLHEFMARLTGASSGHRAEPVGIDDWIGCLAINEPVFFPADEWVPTPADWHGSIMSGKTYDLKAGEGRIMYERCLDRARQLTPLPAPTIAERYGAAQLVQPRLGQASFRIAVLEAYEKRCAITGERSLPVVEASHIRPYAAGGEHEISNGLPMRRDVHRLFDLGFVSVRPDLTFAVSDSLHDAYANGRVYYDLHNAPVREPTHPGDRPDPEVLEWQYEEVFRR